LVQEHSQAKLKQFMDARGGYIKGIFKAFDKRDHLVEI